MKWDDLDAEANVVTPYNIVLSMSKLSAALTNNVSIIF